MNTKALREQRAKIASDANAILDKAVSEGRAATREELETVDKMHADIDALKATIDRAERFSQEERSIVPDTQRDTERAEKEDRSGQTALHNSAFRNWARGGVNSLNPDELRVLQPQAEGNGTAIRLQFGDINETRRAIRENRAQSITTSAGGYTIAREFSNRLEKSMLYFGGMLQVSDVMTTATGAPMDWPTYDDTSNKGARLAINTQASAQDIAFGTVTFDAYKYSSKLVLVPVELMQDAAFDMNSLVADVLGERIGRILNEEFTTADGSSKPNGVVTAAGSGKAAATGQTASVIADDLFDLVYSVDRAYRQNAKFMMNDSTVKAIRKLKDGNGLPLWQPSITAGEPDAILGYPLVVNNDVAAMATSAKSILFGDFSKYKIRRVQDVTLLRLAERYADYHQVGFLAFARFDGDLLDAGTDPIKYFANSAS